MKKSPIIMLCVFMLLLYKTEALTNKKTNIQKPINWDLTKIEDNCRNEIEENPEKLITSYDNINFYTEDVMRGKGVITLSIDKSVEILNIDKTIFGSISFLKEGEYKQYKIKLPETVIAREIMPHSEFEVFEFDSEPPNFNADFLVIYINKQQKLIKKNK